MAIGDRGQVAHDAAMVYERFFVPALFDEWTGTLLDAADVASGQRVLDVACGTGVLARAASQRVGPGGHVAGLDLNQGMLAVAAQKAPEVEWVEGPAEQLPFEAGSFDAVVSQFGLMFFEDRARALAEMRRVARPGGAVAVAVWAPIESSPGYADMARLLEQLFGAEIAAALHAPYCLGDVGEVRSLFEEAGLEKPRIETHTGQARFHSIEEWVHTDIRGWTLAEAIDEAQYQTLLEAALTALQRYANSDGRVVFETQAHVAVSTA